MPNNECNAIDTESIVECENVELNVNIYRYKFTNEFIVELYNFSKIHQYDHRKDFKKI